MNRIGKEKNLARNKKWGKGSSLLLVTPQFCQLLPPLGGLLGPARFFIQLRKALKGLLETRETHSVRNLVFALL